tara:strand:+ start:1923 stop:2162 length:240 start_codon:yes stop_codon:yes gene_type:complete
MSGEFYLLNALWFGAALILIGALLPTIWRVLRFVIIMCIPFGLVAAFHVSRDIATATREVMRRDERDNVTSIHGGRDAS